ncbi:hypothetical protein P2G88_07410 [Aliiglaciecola sp. CAU 1673]|uniref:hypothetical protein n=1 Tax=Aliiglaciecola sp. CAU 1673 TaxID=3032595 RepID=UPI0023DA310B|nr:hypothetical protein [Aliiglaciecola sp. CAU 1673]MDF2178078.1 hypothetical protein [Aliiglaciecola sp. CAU 1673]
MSEDYESVPAPDNFIVSNASTRAENPTSSVAAEVPATKQFVVNATGNLFIATTQNAGSTENVTISREAEEAFSQVSVFFAAMTKAINDSGRSLFDYQAINNLVTSSGLFVKVTQSQIFFESSQWGIKFGNQLIQAIFGLSGNLAAIGKSLMDMIVGMGNQLGSIEMSGQHSNKETRVSTIIFVCEYLLGAVSITPIVITVDAKDALDTIKAGPCFKAQKKNNSLKILKSVYLFVPPAFIKHASTINEAMSDPEFNNLVDSLKSSIAGSGQ